MKDYDKTDWITSAKTLSEALPYLKDMTQLIIY